MQDATTVEGIRAILAPWRAEGVALVPTMGALHRGHAALLARAREVAGRVVASVFVNPTQFGDPRDLALYPRTPEADRALLEEARVDALFAPGVAEMYPEGSETVVDAGRLGAILHGATRPGHFRGVATVVLKLLNAVRPDVALFGEKDYQQLAVIRQVVRDLHVPVEIVGVPTVRDADGLALSSRNARLSPEDRAAAPALHRALLAGRAAGGTGAAIRDAALAVLAAEPRVRDPRVDVVDPLSFEPLDGPVRARAGIMLSARLGDVLLIDQMEVP